jgi:hypothetical protein
MILFLFIILAYSNVITVTLSQQRQILHLHFDQIFLIFGFVALSKSDIIFM